MSKKPSRKTIVRKLDKIVSQIVIERDGKCVVCGTTNNLTCGHLFSRVAYSTRWDLDNCYAQCLSCNLKHEYDPYPMMKVIEEKLGKKMVEAMHRRYVTPHKFKTYELGLLYEELELAQGALKLCNLCF
jgi:hypothetical protein